MALFLQNRRLMRRTPFAALLNDLELILSASGIRWFRILRIGGSTVLGLLAVVASGPAAEARRHGAAVAGQIERY